LIKGFDLGVNEVDALDEAMGEADLDCCLLAGRYTLLDRSAAALLDKAHAQGVVIGGVFNSGILAAGAAGPRKFDYMDASADILRKVKHLDVVCARYGVPLGAAANQFPLRNKAVSSVLVSARSAENITTSDAWFEREIPAELWTALEARA
jgi:D-threo-aldose 1-dehydrogenase